MDTLRCGKSSLFERVEFSLYRFLSSFSKSKTYSDSPQTFAVAEAGFNLTRFEFAVYLFYFLPAIFIFMHASWRNNPGIIVLVWLKLNNQL